MPPDKVRGKLHAQLLEGIDGVGTFSVVGKAWHMILSATPYKCMRVLNDSRWSKGSFDQS